MTTPTSSLLSLISKLEEATGPSRELDALIAVAVGEVPPGTKFWGDQKFAGRYVADDGIREVPRYTRSLDAALTLVPEDFGVSMRTYPRGETGHRHTPHVKIYANRSERDPLVWDTAGVGDGATPALALCIASLRSRSALTGETEK